MKTKARFLLAIFISLILNIIWEFSHYRLYNDLSGISSIPHLFLASFTDMILISGILLVISLKNKNFSWIKKPKLSDYSFVIILGIFIATTIELVNLNLGRWAYKAIMPTIFGIGVSPLIQLFTTAILSLFIIRIIFRFSR
jgi:hypothetical protein